MGSGKAATEEKLSGGKNRKQGRKIPPPSPLGPNKVMKKEKKKKRKLAHTADSAAAKSGTNDRKRASGGEKVQVLPTSASEQLSFFLNQFESANGVRISSLELDSIKDKCIVELSQDLNQDVSNLGKHIKTAFGPSWKEALFEGHPVDGKIDPGNPSVLILSSSALRSLELLRGVRSLAKECPVVKLFSKHMKVEEQVSLLKKRVNVGSGTPNRIKKLIDIEALGLSRLEMIVLDTYPDVKGYSLFTLPQVRDEFWDLYKNYFHPQVLQGDLRICLYGPLPTAPEKIKNKKSRDTNE